MMKRVEKHIIKSGHESFEYCDSITNSSRQLFNSAQFVQRQGFFYGHGTQSQAKLDKMFQQHEAYIAMPSKVSQLVLKQSADSWTAYEAALKAYAEAPSKFSGKPQPPGFAFMRNLVKFNTQAVGKRDFNKGLIVPSMSPIQLPVKNGMAFDDLCEVRIVPKTGCFVIEVVYEQPDFSDFLCSLNQHLAAAVDIGLDNLATIVFSDGKTQPIIVNGKPLKSANQFYNKQVARFKGFLPQCIHTSNRIENIIRNRNHFVDSYLHQSSRMLVNELLAAGVTEVAIGKSERWKTKINLGKRTNQKFVQVPHAKFVEMLTYKLEAVGIKVTVGEESYTSKASFLDWDNIPTYTPNSNERHTFSGKRVTRSWYVSSYGYRIGADVNGGYNIGRKVIPTAFEALNPIVQRDRGCLVVHPRRITPVFRRVHVQSGVA
jgi:IS605 OrfB family transposase